MPARATAYPDDLQQNREDRHNPPIRQATATRRVRQDGAVLTMVGTQTQAFSALSPIAGRDVLPGASVPEDERHWDAPLPVRVRLRAAGGAELRTLRDAADFASGRYMTLEHSAALQKLALLLLTAARRGHPDDMADAGLHLQSYVRLLHIN